MTRLRRLAESLAVPLVLLSLVALIYALDCYVLPAVPSEFLRP